MNESVRLKVNDLIKLLEKVDGDCLITLEHTGLHYSISSVSGVSIYRNEVILHPYRNIRDVYEKEYLMDDADEVYIKLPKEN